uniref:Uncharacterized protein n=1 Tax=Panagrolaimus sp. ES5 TaxID=591445 RepID=A0AC34FR30_9BILA
MGEASRRVKKRVENIGEAIQTSQLPDSRRLCKSVGNLKETQNFERGYMIAYILKNDISNISLKQYRNECQFVTLRIFDSSKYPDVVTNLFEYRWKPIIVKEVLQEVEKVFWVDSSVIFNDDNACETITEIVQKMDTKFFKCGIRAFIDTRHSILFATNPKMLQYFNVSENFAKNNHMLGATLFVISRKGSEIVQKWNNCALEKECMAPKGSHLYCKCEECRTKNIYGNCHRFDQSVLSILTLQCSSNFNDFLETSSLIDVQRM